MQTQEDRAQQKHILDISYYFSSEVWPYEPLQSLPPSSLHHKTTQSAWEQEHFFNW